MTLPSSALIRYNFRVLIYHNWWLLVIPLAVSQLTVFWTATTQRFSPPLPASIVEFVSPLLAAFLCAHLLASEYRSGIGAVLASKPIDISKVVLMRLSIAIALVWSLGWLSLAAFYFGMEPYPMLLPGLAMMVSSLFLALLALTFATLFRHPLAGFGVAALYWLLDLPEGPPMNPYLSLKSLTASFVVPGLPPNQQLTDAWWIAKVLLLAAALALYFLHRKWLFTLGSPLTVRRRSRTLACAGGILAIYIVSGAVVKVVFGYQNRGTLFPNDVGWFRRQFGVYAPLPITALFGPNFRRYVGDIPSSWRVQQEGEADTVGDTMQHRRELEHILKYAPDSIWAASAADLLARLNARGHAPVEERVRYARLVVDRYGTSPYAAYALQSIGRTYADASAQEVAYEPKARAIYEEMLTRFPNGAYRSDAFRFLAESDRRHHNLAEAERHARQWVETGPVYEKFLAQILLAEILRDEGKRDEAKQAAQQTLKAIQDFQRALKAGEVPLSEQQCVRLEQDASQIQGRIRGF